MIEPLVLAFALTLARVGTFIYFLPLLGGPNVPRLVKIGLAAALTALFYNESWAPLAEGGGLLASGSTSWLAFIIAMGREVMLGGVLGFAMSLFLMPARMAGEFITQESGLSFASIVTASGDGSASPLATLFELFASLIFFALDLHHVFLKVLHETFRHYPIGRGFRLPNWDLVTVASAAEETGILLAAPLALCLFLTTVVLALMTRAAPQLNLYSIGFPMRVIVCLGGMLLLLPQLIAGIVGSFSTFVELLQLRG